MQRTESMSGNTKHMAIRVRYAHRCAPTAESESSDYVPFTQSGLLTGGIILRLKQHPGS